mgnify:CR=1 FL=1
MIQKNFKNFTSNLINAKYLQKLIKLKPNFEFEDLRMEMNGVLLPGKEAKPVPVSICAPHTDKNTAD